MAIPRIDLTSALPQETGAAKPTAQQKKLQEFAQALQATLAGADMTRTAGTALPSGQRVEASGAVPTNEAKIADVGAALKDWTGAGRSRKARAKGESDPLGFSAQDPSLAGRYDVVARRQSNERGRVSHRA